MDNKKSMGVHVLGHQDGDQLGDFKWDDLKVFYAVVECGSIRAAAEKLKMSLNAVRHRVISLESSCRDTLLIRSEKGCAPTKKGEKVFEVAKGMLDVYKGLQDDRLNANEEIAGRVSLRTTEGLGSFWIMPKLSSFRQLYPRLIVDLQCEMKTPNLAAYEADLSVQLARPTDEEAIVTKIGYLHLMGFISKEYLEQFGEPSWPIKPPHGFVFQVGPQMANEELEKFLDFEALEDITVATTNSSTSHYFAVANGVGIGILPSYSRAISRKVIPVESGPPPLTREIYLVYNRNVKRTGKIDVVIDWLKEIFSPEIYPWFSEEFIHPDKLEPYLQDDNVVELFKGVDGLMKL
ncbi:MAG: LysR family transcriptional regulator [Sphingomonadales bacterium]|jgi:DNA-binding transcriptional LysR family regulator